jgi:hypothetical protein
MKNLLKTGAAFFAIALLSFVGFSVAHGYGGDPCKVGVTPPAGGFAVKNLSGSPVTNPTIQLEFTAGGDASFVEVSNHSDYSSSWTFPYQAGGTTAWTLLPGYGTKNVYVRYLNSCKALPSPTLIVTVKYQQDACTIGVTPPAGGFGVVSLSGSTVYNPAIQLGLSGGNAAFVQVSNHANFSSSMTYPYSATLNWTLSSGYGSKTVYVRYLNSCKTLPSATVSVTVNYTVDPCTISVTPPAGGFSVTSTSGSTVSSQTIGLDLAGGNAAYAQISNSSNFSSYTTVPYVTALNWTLSSGFGTKTVYVRYLNTCQSLPSKTVSVTVNYINECTIALTPPQNGFMVTSLGTVNVHTTAVTLGMYGGNASFMEVSNNSNFSGSTTYAYAPTLKWNLSSGYGNKTVWVRYLNSCKAMSSIGVSISFTYTK